MPIYISVLDGGVVLTDCATPIHVHDKLGCTLYICARSVYASRCMRVCSVHGSMKSLYKLTATTRGSGFYYRYTMFSKHALELIVYDSAGSEGSSLRYMLIFESKRYYRITVEVTLVRYMKCNYARSFTFSYLSNCIVLF